MSVCPLHAGNASKLMNLGWCNFHRREACIVVLKINFHIGRLDSYPNLESSVREKNNLRLYCERSNETKDVLLLAADQTPFTELDLLWSVVSFRGMHIRPNCLASALIGCSISQRKKIKYRTSYANRLTFSFFVFSVFCLSNIWQCLLDPVVSGKLPLNTTHFSV